MKKIISLFLFIVAAHAVFGQMKQRELHVLLKRMRAIGMVQSASIGEDGAPGENYKNYSILKDKASIQQLVELTDDTSAVVACYAGWALVDRSYENLPSIFYKFLEHEKIVTVFFDCMVSDRHISNEFYYQCYRKLNDKSNNITTNNIYSAIHKMDSIILYYNKEIHTTNDEESLTNSALTNKKYPKTYNIQIEKLAFKGNSIDAILYLYKWYRAEYDDKLEDAIIEQLKKADHDFGKYYDILEALLKFNDIKVKNIVINQLNEDASWRSNKERFMPLLNKYDIHEGDLK